ncbi:MAG TPA: hypothetical protein VG407_01790 [Caulobacteraceae bacterium]|nr:hypothetical protein [Caulobacteraceae bacterium]
MKRSSFGNRSKPDAKKKPLPDRREQAKKAAVRALEKAKRAADRAGVKLSEWEDEFLGSVATRVKTFGRAFADPEKGDPRAPLSMMQAVKLKEITAKAKGDKRPSRGASRKKNSRT